MIRLCGSGLIGYDRISEMPQLFAALLVRRFSRTRADVDDAFLALGAGPKYAQCLWYEVYQ